MFEIIWDFASFVVALGILVTIHEYGHFWVARKNGIKVHRFSVGFGKPLWSKVDKHGTEFVVAAIPLGGYVKMLDERVEEVAEDEKDQAFNNKKVTQRIAVVAAGPIANFLFAIAAFYLMFLLGVSSVKPILGDVTKNSIAAKAGLLNGSEITSVSGKPVKDWQDVNLALIAHIGEPQLELSAKQPDSATSKLFYLDTSSWEFAPEKQSALASLGLIPYQRKLLHEIGEVIKGSAAEQAGLQIGDKPTVVNGVDVLDNWLLFTQEIRKYPEQTITVSVVREGQLIELDVTPRKGTANGEAFGVLGVLTKAEPLPEHHRVELRYGIVDAMSEALAETWQLIVLSFDMIGKLITGDVSVKNLSGPIAIAQGAGDHAEYGFVYFLGFLALISINLGIINILPIPVLDGGHLVYYFIELLTGKPVSKKVQEIGFLFGTLALLGLMSIALFNDFSRL